MTHQSTITIAANDTARAERLEWLMRPYFGAVDRGDIDENLTPTTTQDSYEDEAVVEAVAQSRDRHGYVVAATGNTPAVEHREAIAIARDGQLIFSTEVRVAADKAVGSDDQAWQQIKTMLEWFVDKR